MQSERGNRSAAVVRWMARLGSLASGALLILFMFGGQESIRFQTMNEIIGFCFFPIGILVGMAVAWRYELLGGGLTVLSLAGFYVWHFVTTNKFAAGPYFLIFAAPGILFLLAACAHRTGRTTADQL